MSRIINKTDSKIISLCLSAVLVLSVFMWMPISASAASIGLSAPGNPHWDGDTGTAVWDKVENSGAGGSAASYQWRLYRKDAETPPAADDNDYMASSTINFSIGRADSPNTSISNYLREDGYYYFAISAIGDGLNYTQSPFAVSDAFYYTRPNEKLPVPTGLRWELVDSLGSQGYFATWDNLDSNDYMDADTFAVTCYDKSGNRLGRNVWLRDMTLARGGVQLSNFVLTAASGEYRFTVQVYSSRPNVYQSSDVSDYSPWLTVDTNPKQPSVTSDDSGSSNSSGGGPDNPGSGGTSTPSTPSNPSTQTSSDTKALADKAKANGEDTARSKGTGEVTIQGSALAELSGLSLQHDTVANGAVQVRVTINNPSAITDNVQVSGYVSGPEVERVSNKFDEFFSNTTSVMHLDQTGEWGQPVEIAAKFDLTGMNTGNLVFYSYDSATNKYQLIQSPKYWIDANGYTHFTTSLAGSIIVSNGPLVAK